jgi:hypothetical protein
LMELQAILPKISFFTTLVTLQSVIRILRVRIREINSTVLSYMTILITMVELYIFLNNGKSHFFILR